MQNKRARIAAYTMPEPNRPRTKPTALGPIAPQPVRSPGLELRKKLMAAYGSPFSTTPKS